METTFLQLASILFDTNATLDYCKQLNLIPSKLNCYVCQTQCYYITSYKLPVFRCPRCKRQVSIKNNTIFEDSHLDMKMVLLLLYLWSRNSKQTDIAHELSVTEKTVSLYTSIFRKRISKEISTYPLLGGPGKIVEVDETSIGKRKYNTGRVPKTLWVIGCYERGSKEIRMKTVK